MAARRDWTALPSELLELIAERLGLIELLSLRGVCKDWRSASSTASAEIEALQNHEHWFPLYGKNNSQCTLVAESDRTYSITIPELDGATCIRSNHGWLLLFREGEGSMFFFCPFSRAKIDLPIPEQFPRTLISNLVAIFSSPPTSQDCVACIITKSNERKAELHVIYREATAWTKHELEFEASANKILGAAYHDGAFFFFFDKTKWIICYLIENKMLFTDEISTEMGSEAVPFARTNKVNDLLQLELNKGFLRSICGTAVSCHGFQVMAPCVNTTNAEVPGRRSLKEVWFQVSNSFPSDSPKSKLVISLGAFSTALSSFYVGYRDFFRNNRPSV